jgi:hypothetical protein
MSQRAVLIRAAQRTGTQYSVATGQILESLVRELTLANAERVLELVRRVDDEAGHPAAAGQPDDVGAAN